MYGLAMVVRCCVVSCVVWLNNIKQWQSKVRWSQASSVYHCAKYSLAKAT